MQRSRQTLLAALKKKKSFIWGHEESLFHSCHAELCHPERDPVHLTSTNIFTLRVSNVHSSCWLQIMGEKPHALCVLGHSLLHKIVTWIVQGQRAPFLPSNKIFELNKISTLKSALSPLFTMNWAGLKLDLVGLSLVGSRTVQLCTPGWEELLGTGSRRNSHKEATRILSVDFLPLIPLIGPVALTTLPGSVPWVPSYKLCFGLQPLLLSLTWCPLCAQRPPFAH